VLAQLRGRIEKTPFLHWLRLRLRDGNPDVRAGILEAFGRMGDSLVYETDLFFALTSALQDEDVLVRIKATEALRRVTVTPSHQAEALSALTRAALYDAEWLVRRGARQTLLKLRDDLDQFSEELAVLLDVQFAQQHSSAMDQEFSHSLPVAQLLPSASNAALVAALRDPDAGVRVKALARLQQLGAAGVQHPDSLPALAEIALHDVDSGVRACAVETLGHVGTLVLEHPNVLVVITTALRDRDAGVRARAANALGQFALPSEVRQEALSALLTAVEDADSEVRFAAADALGQLTARGIRIFRRWWGKRESKMVEELAAL
jgi:HEAT repeat protein